VLRAKYEVMERAPVAVAVAGELRLPTGDDAQLLGTGATQGGVFVIGSARFGAVSPHLNLGYRLSTNAHGQDVPDEIDYTGGFDWALGPRVTLAADVLGRTLRGAQVVRVVPTQFQANTNTDPAAPPTLVTGTFPRLLTAKSDSTNFLGSVGLKINPFGNVLLTVNGLFSISGSGLKDKFSPLVGLDYSF
jgi:hypothetical protein